MDVSADSESRYARGAAGFAGLDAPQEAFMAGRRVRVAPSLIPGAGRGLFAMVDLSRGDVLCRVTGRTMSEEEATRFAARSKYGDRYFLGLSDGVMNVRSAARYANDACGPVQVPGIRNNCRFIEGEDGSVWLEATRLIRAEEECFVGYGRPYWSARMARSDTPTSAGGHVTQVLGR